MSISTESKDFILERTDWESYYEEDVASFGDSAFVYQSMIRRLGYSSPTITDPN